MSKTITSPVKRFPGTITIPDFLTVPQARAWEKSLKEADALRETIEVSDVAYIEAWIPGISAVVSEWNLENFSIDPFQTTPRVAVLNLFTLIIGEVNKLYWDDSEIPNG
jgi:hypothetical protein